MLFDKDGTLLDFESTWVPAAEAAVAAVAARFGAGRVDAAQLLASVGFDSARRTFPPTSPVTTGSLDEAVDAFAALLPAVGREALRDVTLGAFLAGARGRAVAKPGLHAALDVLRAAGLHLGVVTMDSAAGADEALGILGVRDAFGFVAGADSGFGHKPGPGMVDAYRRAFPVPAGAVCVVGDTLHDIGMGRAAGAGLVVGVTTGAGDPVALARAADATIAQLDELPALLVGTPGRAPEGSEGPEEHA